MDVRLGASELESFVKGDKLSSNKIVARSKISRNGEFKYSLVLDELVDAKLLSGAIISVLEDFEPNSSVSSIRSSHVDKARTFVVRSNDVSVGRKSSFITQIVRVMPLNSDFRSSFYWTFTRCILFLSDPSAFHVSTL